MRFAYFGSSQVSIYVLDELIRAGFMPALVVTTPDKPQGRGLAMAQNVMKSWALERGLRITDPAELDAAAETALRAEACDLFIVASYGKIIPKSIVFMPSRGTLNMHPSPLPRYRGAAPLPQTMLDDARHTGATIMRMDEKMDHGPIIASRQVEITEWPTYEEFEERMAREGGRLLAEVLPDWIAGRLPEREQDHARATFTKKILKEDALLDLSGASSFAGDTGYANFRKIQAYHGWPLAYFMAEKLSRTETRDPASAAKKLRVKIASASFKDNRLVIERVVPEGSREMAYGDFLKGYRV